MGADAEVRQSSLCVRVLCPLALSVPWLDLPIGVSDLEVGRICLVMKCAVFVVVLIQNDSH